MSIELFRLEPISDEGAVPLLATGSDPQWRLTGKVTSAPPAAPCDVGETYAFGIDDPVALGLAEWRPGDSLDIGLVARGDAGQESWQVVGVPPH